MKVRVRYFASLRETVGLEQEEFELAAGSSVEHLLAALAGAHRGLDTRLAAVRAAVNRCYVSMGTLLKDGDEVALVPPVGGG
jgi:molybdopterin converting factor subunit 1